MSYLDQGERVRLFFAGRPALINKERSKHWREHRAATKALRTEACLRALSARLSDLGAVEVYSYPTYATRRSWPDVGAWAPSVKAILDGLVDAEVLSGDGPDVVVALHFYAPRLGDEDGLVVDLIPRKR